MIISTLSTVILDSNIGWAGLLQVSLSCITIALGLFFVLAGSIGVLRFPDFYTRLHAAGMTDTLGAELILIGLGPHKKLLEEQYQYQNIKFLGQLPNIKVKNILQESTAVVTATKLYEGQPTLLCEASLSKVPSIFPDTGGVKEFFPKNTQYIFEQFNYQDLVSKLESLSNLNQVEKEGKKNYDYLKAKISISKIKSNFDEIKLMAVGGVNPINIKDYLGAGADAVALGGSIFSTQRMANCRFEEIQKDIETTLIDQGNKTTFNQDSIDQNKEANDLLEHNKFNK